MSTSNPVLSRYEGFSPHTTGDNVITFDNVLGKAIIQMAVLAVAATLTAIYIPVEKLNLPVFGAMGIALILSFVITLKKTSNPPLILLYAAVEGIFVGGLSKLYESLYDGIVPIAVLSTAITAGVIILGMRAGILRTSGRTRQIFFYACIGYLIFSLVAIGLSFAGIHLLTLGSPLAIIVSVFGTFMACFSFLTDVENVNNSVGQPLGKNEDWRLGFGLMVSLVWLYLEILRLIANIFAAGDN